MYVWWYIPLFRISSEGFTKKDQQQIIQYDLLQRHWSKIEAEIEVLQCRRGCTYGVPVVLSWRLIKFSIVLSCHWNVKVPFIFQGYNLSCSKWPCTIKVITETCRYIKSHFDSSIQCIQWKICCIRFLICYKAEVFCFWQDLPVVGKTEQVSVTSPDSDRRSTTDSYRHPWTYMVFPSSVFWSHRICLSLFGLRIVSSVTAIQIQNVLSDTACY